MKINLQDCPSGSVGHALLDFMNAHGFEFVPYYIKHDLKHTILGYDPSPSSEMRMQAFMFGNGGFRLLTTLMTLSFLIWTPDVWKELPYHFLAGRMTRPIRHLKVEDLATCNLAAFRQEIGLDVAFEKAQYIVTVLGSPDLNRSFR